MLCVPKLADVDVAVGHRTWFSRTTFPFEPDGVSGALQKCARAIAEIIHAGGTHLHIGSLDQGAEDARGT